MSTMDFSQREMTSRSGYLGDKGDSESLDLYERELDELAARKEAAQEERMDANIESLADLTDNLKEQGFDINKIPYVLQLNKRDLAGAAPAEELARQLLVKGEPVIEAVATQGVGVVTTLKAVARQVLVELRKSA